MTFDTWITYIDEAHQHARLILDRLDHADRPSDHPDERATLEAMCRRFVESCPPTTLLVRPEDVMEFEWEEAPYAILVARLQSVYEATTTRSKNVHNWLSELRVAVHDYITDWTWFDKQIER